MAEDLMQDTFVKAYTKANTYSGKSSVKTFM
ncbi:MULTISPECIES: RNA polymerase sigma factor [Bacillus]